MEKEKLVRLEDKIRKLEVKRDKSVCRTCPQEHEGICPALRFVCFTCKEVGFAENSRACRNPKPPGKPPGTSKRVDKSSQVQEAEEETDENGGKLTLTSLFCLTQSFWETKTSLN